MQNCKISPVSRGLSVSLSVCVSVVCVIIVRTGRTVAKIKGVQIMFVDFDICHRMMSLQKHVLSELDIPLKVRDSNRDFSYSQLPFKCDECEYCCIQSSFLGRHKFIHSS